MIIFKGLINKQFNFKDVKILCLIDAKKYDFELQEHMGEKVDENKILNICINTIFINSDKKYILKYDNVKVIPNNELIDNDDYGIIDMTNRKIVKQINYKHNKIVSFCLYGDKEMYLKGALKNLEQYSKTYPDWKCYFYIRNDVDKNIVEKIKESGGHVIECIDSLNWYMMFTRFFPYENKLNEIYLSRDCDSRLTKREEYSIKQWFDSNKGFHIIRDHPWHCTSILGGMWGAKGCMDNLRFMIMDWCISFLINGKNMQKGPDQFFLKELYNLIKDDMFVNDEFFNYESEKYKINLKRVDCEYIGEPYDENDNIDLDMRKPLEKYWKN
jgi:hypothetical protein